MEIRDSDKLMLFDKAGNAVEAVDMKEAHARLAAFFIPVDGRTAYGWPERRAGDALAAIFTGRSGT